MTQALRWKKRGGLANFAGRNASGFAVCAGPNEADEVLLTLGRLDDSQKVSQAIVRMIRSFAGLLLAGTRHGQGQCPGSIEQYRKACQLWPSFGTAHYALALAYQGTGATAEAQQHMAAYQKYKADGDPQPEDPQLEAVRSLDNTALAHLMKGVDLENAGQLDGAIAEHEEAVKQDPKFAQAHANLIALYARRTATRLRRSIGPRSESIPTFPKATTIWRFSGQPAALPRS